MSEYIAPTEYWKVIDEDFNTHTDGITFDEAVTLSRELNELFPNQYYIPYPDPEFEEKQEHLHKLENRRFRASIDGWEDLYPDRENN